MGKVTESSFNRQTQCNADKADGANIRRFSICNGLRGQHRPCALGVDSMLLCAVGPPVD